MRKIFIILLLLTTNALASVAVVQHQHGDTSGGAATSVSATITSTTAGNNLFFQLNVGGSPFLTSCVTNTTPSQTFRPAAKGSNNANQSYSGYLLNVLSGATSVKCTSISTDTCNCTCL